jgi:hypothetical protein
MAAFNWDKMSKTPQGNLVRKEAKDREAMSLKDRVGSYEIQAHNDLNEHSRYSELVNDIKKRLEELVHGDDSRREDIAHEIAERHDTTITNDKGIEGEDEQIAYILALAQAIKSEEPRRH